MVVLDILKECLQINVRLGISNNNFHQVLPDSFSRERNNSLSMPTTKNKNNKVPVSAQM